jgi:hypothetical protein
LVADTYAGLVLEDHLLVLGLGYDFLLRVAVGSEETNSRVLSGVSQVEAVSR